MEQHGRSSYQPAVSIVTGYHSQDRLLRGSLAWKSVLKTVIRDNRNIN